MPSTDPRSPPRLLRSPRPPPTPPSRLSSFDRQPGPHTCTQVATALQSGILPAVRVPDFGRDNDRIYRPQERPRWPSGGASASR
jgi:hypothetical protein